MGFGGACPDGYQPIQVAQGELNTCYVQNADGTENWEQIYTQLGDVTFGGRAFTSNADPASREVILATLTTLAFDQWTPPAAQPSQPDLAAICPVESEGTTLFVSPEYGWCFLYPLAGQTPEQALEPISPQIDANSVQTTTIAGYPAVVYDFTGGPWRQRNAQIVVGDWVYTFVGQPWDAVEFPEALADVETLWNSAVDSIAFFDKWR